MKRYQWIGIILFLPILFLWTSASTHAAPLAGDVGRMHRDAPRVFAIYQRGIRNAQ